MGTLAPSSPFVGRLMVVADKVHLSQWLHKQYPTVEIATAPSYLSGIAELANGPVHAIVGYVDPAFNSLDKAVRGMRQALGEKVPLVLCCRPEAETMARQALSAGASDYVIYPPQANELNDLLSLQPPGYQAPAVAPATDSTEMKALSKVLESLSSVHERLLERLAELLAAALPASWVVVSADGVKGQFGDSTGDAVMVEPINKHDLQIGEVRVGESQGGAYTHADVDKLRYYAEMFGHIVHTAKQQREWQQLAMTDDLTSLNNRRHLLQFLDRILQRAGRERFRVTVCMFDIDNFKQYNDEFGHAAGDEIIRATAQLFLRRCRLQDVVARYGGDEFVVVFWDAEQPRIAGSEHPDEAIGVMKRFQEALKQHEFGCLGPKAKGVLTISGGLATYPWDAVTRDDLLNKANLALREAKRQGKNSIHLIGTNIPRNEP